MPRISNYVSCSPSKAKATKSSTGSPPPPGYIKLNNNVALSSTRTALAIIARDNNGSICNIWTKLLSQRSPLQVEAEVLLWTVHITNQENWSYIILESNLKIFIDSLSSSVPDSDWSTSTIFSNLLDFGKCFSVCSFVWTSRTSNFVAHIAAKLALFYYMPFPFNKDNLPLALVVACKED